MVEKAGLYDETSRPRPRRPNGDYEMRKFLLAAAGFAALAGMTGAAMAQDNERPRRGDVFFQADANNDGAVTRQEFDASRTALFTRLDANNDGYLSREEMRAQFAGRGGERRGHRGAGHLRGVEAGPDGSITREQFLARPNAAFDRLDRNNDGVISADERPQRPQRAEGAERRQRPNIDTDGDGRISRAEFDAAGAAMFQRLDANNDGRVTREEAQAARPQRGARN